ncbi:major facilitator superfamily domain-containing protein [Phlebopus sp. FC_14]|nr:major facilitator superfamily domain-containing protein [Phlebopus sp. FC_14]
MATEESPLLAEQYEQRSSSPHSDEIYDRFSRSQKNTISFIVSFAGLVPMFVAGSFVPSIPQIAKDLDASPATVSLAVSLSVFSSAFGALVWSAYSSFYGRRPMYLCGIPLLCIGSFGVAAAPDLSQLLFWRFVQTFGCSGGFSVGAGVIGDIYKLEERGTAMGSFFGATLLGLAIAPITGGTAAQYWSWRGFQFALGVSGIVQMLMIHVFLPETAHPNTRGIDKLGEGSKFVWINPFSTLRLLRSPNILAVVSWSLLSSDTVLLIPLAYTIGVRYGITSEALIGACFLPNGLGNFVGAPIAGRLSDAVIKKWIKKRNGVWVPEDRLRAVYVGSLFLVPLSVSAAGLVMAYIDGPVGLALTLLCLFTNGMGVDMVLTPIGSYNVDLMQNRGAEVMAAVTFVPSFLLSVFPACSVLTYVRTAFRSLLLAPVSAMVIPFIERFGVAATNGMAALLALLGHFLIWLTIRYGDRMRAYVDVGYQTD